VWHVAALFLAAALLRWFVAPTHNLAEDSFELVEAGKHLLLTGEYRVPGIGDPDLVLRQRIPSWPVGFPLILAGAFGLFGPEEGVARIVTIACSSLLAPLTAGIAQIALGNPAIAIGAGLLAAVHPLAAAFGGQIFTNNISTTLFFVSLYFLMSSLAKEAGGPVLSYPEVAEDRRRLRRFGVAFLAFGLTLAVRDTDLMLAPALIYLLWRAGIFRPPWNQPSNARRAWVKLVLIAGVAFLIGWSPSLYSNAVNFGSPLISTHYQTGIRLSVEYLLRGGEALGGMPGILVMLSTFLVYHFPFFASLIVLRSMWTVVSPLVILGVVVMLPILLVNGAFPVSATGAAPRYVLPLVPFTAILTACAVPCVWRRASRWVVAAPFIIAVIAWQAVMTYPPAELFRAWPRFGYLAYYAPAYVASPYHNYPDHTNAMVQWVREHTPHDAVIVTPSRSQHFFYYGKRDVIVLDALNAEQWRDLVAKRPVYVVEDNKLAVRAEQVASLKRLLADLDFHVETVGTVPSFNPEVGDTAMHAYRISPLS
jgi:hypothetical protein